MMKYFTLDDWISDQGDEFRGMEAVLQTRKKYEDYLSSVANQLPPELVGFQRTVAVNDANLRKVDVDVEQKRAVLVVDTYPVDAANNSQVRTLALQYEQVGSFRSTSDPQEGLPGPFGYGDIGGDEIEMLAEGIFEHRFLFSSGIELAIQFGGFTMRDVAE